ncbi:MAG: hypothetical protein QNJ17_14420 [Desulfocapsaceae bacterium]|nr:hypothetical protein [Desulfocapsaceae bacterium]
MTNDSISVQQLGEITAYDEDEQKTTLATMWKEKKAVLIFVRHFG